MPEAFDLSRMLAEIVEDEKISTSKRKKISQADIRRMLRERSQAEARKKRTEPTPREESPDAEASSSPESEMQRSAGPPPGPRGGPSSSAEVSAPGAARTGERASPPAAIAGATVVEVSGSRSPRTLVPPRLIQHYRAIPMGLEDRTLSLGMENPNDLKTIQELELITGFRVEPVAIPRARVEEALAALNRNGWPAFALSETEDTAADPTSARNLLRTLAASPGFDLLVTAGTPPVIKTHLGLERTGLPPITSDQCVQCAKGLMTERQWETLLQRHAIDLAVDLPALGRFRVNAYRQNNSVSLTVRKVPKAIASLKDLAVPASLDSIATKPHGLVIFAAPTGQGKTTTLNAVLHCVNTTMECNVITLEDPVEYVHAPVRSTINQREIGRDAASFSEGLKNVCRQAPDVIVIGEARDPKTFRLALDAASSGHLVLCTMPAFNATNAIDNMIHQFPYHLQTYVRQQIAESLLLVFCQRLVPTVDRQSLIVLHETLFNSPRIKELLREGRISLLRTQPHQGEEDFVPMDLCLKTLLHEGRIAVQDGAPLAENPAFALGADIHPLY